MNGEVKYELSLTADEASRGVSRLLTRNGKRLQVTVPAGVADRSVVKLTNALQTTDGKAGDILISIRIKTEESEASGKPRTGVVEITDSTFASEVLASELPVVVDFWAPWCGPCRMMAPIMEKTAAQYQGKFKFCKINVDENPAMAGRYQAMSIPLLLFFKQGEAVDKIVGAVPEPQLRAKLDSLL